MLNIIMLLSMNCCLQKIICLREFLNNKLHLSCTERCKLDVCTYDFYLFANKQKQFKASGRVSKWTTFVWLAISECHNRSNFFVNFMNQELTLVFHTFHFSTPTLRHNGHKLPMNFRDFVFMIIK